MEAIRTESYAVYFAADAYRALHQQLGTADYSQVFILTDSNTSHHCLPNFLKGFPPAASFTHLNIPAGEAPYPYG